MFRMLLTAVAFLVSTLLASGTAEARRDRREGFNFGASVRLVNDDDRTFSGDHSDKDVRSEANGQSVTPYLGYAFSAFNLGLSLQVDDTKVIVDERDVATGNKASRSTHTKLSGASLFTRFLFGKYFYFEAAGGIYQQESKVKNEYTSELGDNMFNGQREEYVVRGIGPGYNLGAGVEVPIDNGFYFTTGYLVRIVQLRDVDGGGATGGDRLAYRQRREISFGIAHYYR